MVNQPGLGVMTLKAALTDGTTAVSRLRITSMIVPQGRLLDLAQSMVTDSYAFAGSAKAAMKLTDSVTGALLVEAVDQRAGDREIESAASFEWNDAQNAMDYWAQKIPNRILQLQGKNPPQS
jgi:hypothetical protein